MKLCNEGGHKPCVDFAEANGCGKAYWCALSYHGDTAGLAPKSCSQS